MGHETIAKFLKFASLLYLKQRKMSILRNKKRHHRLFSGRVLMNIAISLLVSKCWFYKWNPRGMLVVLYGFRCSHRFWSQSRVMLVTCSIQLIGFREMKPENPMIFMGKSGWFPVKIFPSTNRMGKSFELGGWNLIINNTWTYHSDELALTWKGWFDSITIIIWHYKISLITIMKYHSYHIDIKHREVITNIIT